MSLNLTNILNKFCLCIYFERSKRNISYQLLRNIYFEMLIIKCIPTCENVRQRLRYLLNSICRACTLADLSTEHSAAEVLRASQWPSVCTLHSQSCQDTPVRAHRCQHSAQWYTTIGHSGDDREGGYWKWWGRILSVIVSCWTGKVVKTIIFFKPK